MELLILPFWKLLRILLALTGIIIHGLWDTIIYLTNYTTHINSLYWDLFRVFMKHWFILSYTFIIYPFIQVKYNCENILVVCLSEYILIKRTFILFLMFLKNALWFSVYTTYGYISKSTFSKRMYKWIHTIWSHYVKYKASNTNICY